MKPSFPLLFYFIFIFLKTGKGWLFVCWLLHLADGWELQRKQLLQVEHESKAENCCVQCSRLCERYYLWQIDDLFYIIVCHVLRMSSLHVLWWMHHLLFSAVLLSKLDFVWCRHSPWTSTWDLTWKHIHKKTIISVHTQNVERDMLMNTSWRTTSHLIMKRLVPFLHL